MNGNYTSRRLKNESKKWNKNYIYIDSNTVEVKIIIPEYQINTSIIIKITDCYPFQPPEVFFKNKNIIEIIRTYFQEDYVKITRNECMCCSSILCENNWLACKNIKDVVKDIKNLFIIKKRLIERTICKKLQNYHLHQVPIHEYL